MSKKDLLERISHAPATKLESRPVRRPEEGDARLPADKVTTRVSGTVVRRRKQPGEVEEAPTVVRRRAVDLRDTPTVRNFDPAASRAPEPATARDPQAQREPAATPEESPAPPTRTRAPDADSRPAREPVAARNADDEGAEPPPAPVEAPERAPEPSAPEPVHAAEPEAGRAPEVVEAEEPARAPAPQRSAPAAARPMEVPDTPRYAGLGKAVVMPPPGYDPTNPNAWRREAPPRGAPRGGPPAPPAPAAADPYAGRRRRVESTEDTGTGRRPARRTPSGPGRSGAAEVPRFGAKRKVLAGKSAGQRSSPGPKAAKRKVRIDNVVSVGQLAHELGVKAAVVIRHLMGLGKIATINEMLDLDTAALVAAEFDYEVENVGFQEGNYLPTAESQEEEGGRISRAPVVAVMGHVDHGKTTLLDAIRTARVASGEAGGITQHIGAYQVERDGRQITFLDTPGHQAFSAMRARGAGVTDIVVLVVAADDGVQPQTEEALAHAKAAGVPIVVAVNKMDKPGVNPDNIKQRLAEKDLVPEDWGGDTMFVPVSALRQTGIDELLEAILLQAEVLDLKANPERLAEGTVIEAKMERGRGPVATVLVQKGTLNHGDYVVLGSAFGKVRAMVDYTGKRLKSAPPSTPVELFGLSELPEVGDKLAVVENEKNARALAEHRAQEKRTVQMGSTRRATAEDLFAAGKEQTLERVLVILKADVQGSLEALKGALGNLAVGGTEVVLIHAAVGDISESDVNLASANGAMLLGFNVAVDARGRAAAQEQGVEPELFEVIYDLLDRVERQLKGRLAPVYHAVRQGTVEVRVLFKISKVGVVAGSYVLDGKVARGNTARVVRNGNVVWEGKISALKRFKDDVREVAAGYECGVSLDGFHDVEVGDLLEVYAQEQVAT